MAGGRYYSASGGSKKPLYFSNKKKTPTNKQLAKKVSYLMKQNFVDVERYGAYSGTVEDTTGTIEIVDSPYDYLIDQYYDYARVTLNIQQNALASDTLLRLIIFTYNQSSANTDKPLISDLVDSTTVGSVLGKYATGVRCPPLTNKHANTTRDTNISIKKDILVTLDSINSNKSMMFNLNLHGVRQFDRDQGAGNSAYNNVLCYALISNESVNLPTVNLMIHSFGRTNEAIEGNVPPT